MNRDSDAFGWPERSANDSEDMAYDVSPSESAATECDGVWRDGDMMVVARGASLPNRCVSTNVPAEARLTKAYSWHPQWVYALLISPIFYFLFAMILRRKSTIELPLSQRVRDVHRKGIIGAWICALLGIALIAFSFTLRSRLDTFDLQMILGFSGLLIAIFGTIICLGFAKLGTPVRIDKTHTWLKGVNPEYLATLPEWPAAKR